jgi:CHAT domain-containing protein/tetratricopeptide (TPR) repeat protein
MLLLLAAQLLQPGAIIDREIKTGDSHKYEITLQKGQFLHCLATQYRIDLAMLLDDPAKKTVTALNRLWQEGTEDLPWVAETAGSYTVSVDGKLSNGPATYKLVCHVRTPTASDTARAQAYESAWRAGLHWDGKQDAESKRKAITSYEAALPLWRQVPDPSWEAWTLSQVAFVYEGLGETGKAVELWYQSAALRRKTGEKYPLAITLNNLGTTLNDLGENEKALPLLEEGLALRIETNDRLGEANARGNLGLLYFRWNEYDKALDYYNQALRIRREIKNRSGESTSLITLGNLYLARGELQRALDHHIEALKIREELKSLGGQADAHGAIGLDYLSAGEYARARQHWERAAALYTETGSKLAVASAQHNLGRISLATGDIGEAEKRFEDALKTRRAGGAKIGETMTLSALCETRLLQKDPGKAAEYANQGLAVARAINSRASIAANLQCLARTTAQPQALLNEALQLFREIGSPDEQSKTLALLAAVAPSDAAALPLIEESARIAESMRGAVASSNLRATFRAARADRVDLHTGILMRLGQTERAFNTAEKARARSLVEMMGEARTELRQDLSAEQAGREEQLIGAITATQRLLFRPNLPAARRRELEQKLSGAEREFDLFQIELRRAGNRYATGQYGAIATAKSIQAGLAPGSALLEFALGEKQSFVWAITAKQVQGAALPGRGQIEPRIEAFRKLAAQPVNALTARTAQARLDAEAAALYKILLAPLEPVLGGVSELTVVPDGALAYLPFEALPTPGGRLLNRFRIAYAPSASTLSALRDRPRAVPSQSLFALADPAFEKAPALLAERGFDFTRLPNTRAEVAAIRQLFAASKVFLGVEAGEAALKSTDLTPYRYIHLAAHGYFDEANPSRSGIVLTPGENEDGVLQAHEVMRLRMNADLVTLSACQTGLGKLLAGEGVQSLTRAFFYAGAQSLVVSLWNVNDAATAELMKSFYMNLKRGLPRHEALRQAKLAMTRNPRWSHPYYWAPFVFTGLHTSFAPAPTEPLH